VSIRSILVLGLALVFGGSAAFGINAFLRQSRGEEPSPVETVPVVVTAEEVSRFAALSSDVLVVRNFPKENVPAGSLKSLEEVVDRVTLVSLGKNEAVIADKISAKGIGRGLVAVIPKGMRAFTINTPNVASHVAGFILPGSKVDVLLTIKSNGPDDGTGGTVTTTLLQNMEILAVDQRVEAAAASKLDVKELRSVTLLVSPEQAAKLDMGQNAGMLHLALRNPEDTAENLTQPATLAQLKLSKVPQVVEKKETVSRMEGTSWNGNEDLEGRDKLSFQFHADGRALMLDAQGRQAGTWVQVGNHVEIDLPGVVKYNGTIDSNVLSGEGKDDTHTWKFNVTYSGTSGPAPPPPQPTSPAVIRTLRGTQQGEVPLK
jgi:pilus assembly protein CpaB